MSAPTAPVRTAPAGPVAPADRLGLLDILRGLAVLGMIIVHLSEHAQGGGALGAAVERGIHWFVREKAFATFTILFGVGFGIQLSRAEARGADIRWPFLRRLVGMWILIMITLALVGRGGAILFYAYCGVWLLAVRGWSPCGLLAAVAVTATLGGVWNLAVGGYQWATLGAEASNAAYQPPRMTIAAQEEAERDLRAAYQGTSYPRVVLANIEGRVLRSHIDLWGNWPAGRPGLLLDSLTNGYLMYFLLGLIGLRMGLLHRPADHRRLLLGTALVGAGLWAIDH